MQNGSDPKYTYENLYDMNHFKYDQIKSFIL